MSKVRVYEVAKQLNMDQKSLVALFQSIGVGDVRNHMSAVESDQVERLKRHLERQKTPEVVEERIRPTVVKRKARANEPEVPVSAPSQSGAAGPGPASHSGIAPHAPASSAGTVVRRSAEGSSRGVSIQAKPESKPFIAPPPSAPESAPSHPEPEISVASVPAAPPSEQRTTTLRSDLPVEPSPPVVAMPVEPAPRSSAKRSQKGSRAGAAAPPSTSVGNLDFDGDDREAPVVAAVAPVVAPVEVAAPVVREPTPPPPAPVVEAAVKPEPVVVEEAPQTQVSPAREPEPRRPAAAVVPPPPVVEPGPPPSTYRLALMASAAACSWARVRGSAEAREGFAAFLAKRPAPWIPS